MFGAYFNVMINLKDIADAQFKREVRRAARAARLRARTWRGPRWAFVAGGTRVALGGWPLCPAERQMTHLVPTQMSQKVAGLLEEAKRGSAVVLSLLDERAA